MPAHEAEIREMLEEGVILQELTIPTKVIGDAGKVEYLECLKAELGPPDKSGRRRPVPIPDSENRLPVGAIIRAIGQRPNLTPFPGLGNLDLTKWETIDTDPVTQQSNMPDVFAGGDVATGPATVVEAIGGGKRAAAAIHACLRNLPMPKSEPIRPRRMIELISISYEEKCSIGRHEIPTINIERRMTSFDQVELGLDEDLAKEEAKRCLRCDICERCWKCQEVCAEKLGVSAIQFLDKDDKSLVIADHAAWIERCIACGSCVNICPTGALQLRQQDGELTLLMNGAIVNKVQMEECEGCGIYYVPSRMVEHIAERLEIHEATNGKKLCQECKRIERASAMMGEEPDFSNVAVDQSAFPNM
jgi:ferredoxin